MKIPKTMYVTMAVWNARHADMFRRNCHCKLGMVSTASTNL